MYKITSDKMIHITRGDVANIVVSAVLQDNTPYEFEVGDIVRFKVVEKNNHGYVVLSKTVDIEEEGTTTVTITLDSEDTKIGDIINKPMDYWYEVELNPHTDPQTIIGYDEKGPKVFRLYPEGRDVM